MKVKVKFFALYKELVGKEELNVEIKEGSTVKEVLFMLFSKYPELKKQKENIILTLNRDYALLGAKLKPKDELALIPPVSGG